ncbi:hypothetical protein FJ208_00565 [Candidatus Gribaldobacteria bacterium]|nr:hypothetical protein [Candidatus Gribaldobacteria bacterium]
MIFFKPKSNFKIIPTEKAAEPKWQRILFFCSFLPLIFIGAVYFYVFNKINSLNKEKEFLQGQIITISVDPKNQAEEKKFLSLKTQINDFGSVFQKHQTVSGIFSLIQDFCHKNIQFTSLTMSLQEGLLELSGRADNFVALSEQLIILREWPDVENPQISDIKLEKDGKVNFRLSFNFNLAILQNKKDE